MARGNREVLRMSPGQRWLPEKDRQKSEVTQSAKAGIDRCCLGSAAWPLVFLGVAGGGKTCAALTMLDTYGGHYRTAAEWAEELADATYGKLVTSNGYTITRDDVRDKWIKTNLAVLDELGSRERVSDHHYDAVKWVLDIREGRPLIVISNLSMEKLDRIYDERITSRLGGGTIVTLTGDRRLANGAMERHTPLRKDEHGKVKDVESRIQPTGQEQR